MFFTCKNFMCSDFTWEKKLWSRKWWGEGWRPLCPPFPTALISDILVGFFLDVLFLLLAVILSEL